MRQHTCSLRLSTESEKERESKRGRGSEKGRDGERERKGGRKREGEMMLRHWQAINAIRSTMITITMTVQTYSSKEQMGVLVQFVQTGKRKELCVLGCLLGKQ